MRLLLCLNNDLVSNYALNLLWKYVKHHQVSIVMSEGIGPPSTPKATAFERWGQLERARVNEYLYPLREQQASEGFRTFRQLAQSMDGEERSFASISRPEAVAHVSALAPDLIVAIRYGHIFKAPLFDIPRYGILNLHAGLLPAYRGIYASFWAMLNREKEIGCTLHTVRDAGIDTGDILEEHRMRADYGRSVMWNIAMLYHGAAQMIARAVATIEKGDVPVTKPQTSEGAGYYSYPVDADIARFERQGCKLYEERDYDGLFQAYGLKAPAVLSA